VTGAALWRVWLDGVSWGDARSRQAAMNLADRPWRRGSALIKHMRTVERWERRGGSWFRTDPHGDEPKEAA